MPESLKLLAVGCQVTFVVAGCVLFWQHVASPRARERAAAGLPPWDASAPDFLFYLLHVLGGGFFGSLFAGLFTSRLALATDHATMVLTAGAHLGMLGGIGAFSISTRGRLALANNARSNAFVTGAATFLIALPFVFLMGILWTGLLQLAGLPVERQLAVEIFSRTTSTPWLLFMALTAVIIAPTTEELLFRAGLFRFLRTRSRRWIALLLPASIFGAMHGDLATYAQLVLLGVIFSLAYERTGKIGTCIVAHALFNLNMLLMLLARVGV